MKKLCSLLISICIFVTVFNRPVMAIEKDPPISIRVNAQYIMMDTKPVMMDDTAYVPIRFVANALCADISWEEATRTITIIDGETTIVLNHDSNMATVNDEPHPLPTAPPVVDNRTLVPIRFIAEHMNCQVNWNANTYTVEITKEDLVVPAVSIINRGYTDDDLLLLARIVTVEAGNINFDAKIAVANVVINRKKSPEFPNTIKDVIYDKNYCIQFPPAHKTSFASKVPSKDSIIAAKMALEGTNNISACLFFNNRPFKSKAKDFYKKIDGEYFYK